MDSWQRFLKTVKFEKVDYVPVALLGTPRFFASLADIPLFECLHDPGKLIQVEAQAFQRFPDVTFIPGCWPDLGVGIFSAFGCKIHWPKDAMPWVKEVAIKSEQDIKFLKIPDPKHGGLMPWYLKTLSRFAEERSSFSNNLRFLWSNGQGELASHLWGMQEVLMNIHLKPKLVQELLKKLTEFIINWLEVQLEIMGKAEGILFTDDISGLVSQEMYEEFLLPYHCQIREKFKDYIFVFHCDTKSDHILQSLLKVKFDVFNLGPTTDLANAKKEIGEKICLMGNVDPVDIMQNGQVEKVEGASRICMKAGMRRGGYILSVGGGLNEKTPAENIDAMVKITKLEGIY